MSSPVIEYVVVFADFIANDDRHDVLLVLKDRPAWMAGRLNLVGGKVDPGETPITAAIRELKEESGLDGHNPQYCGRIEGTKSLIHTIRVMVDPLQQIVPRPGETEKVDWYDWDVVQHDERLMPNLRITIPLIQDLRQSSRTWLLEDRTLLEPGVTHHDVYLTIHDRWRITLGHANEEPIFTHSFIKKENDGK